MNSYVNVHLQLTKEVLQAIGKDHQYISRYQRTETILADIYRKVQSEAMNKKTKFIYNMNALSQNDTHLIPEITRKLRNEFTGCMIEYVETKGYDGSVVERVIVIDWS